MGNTAQVANTGIAKDVLGAQAIIAFQDDPYEGEEFSGADVRWGTSCTQVSGDQISYAHCTIPIKTLWDEQGPAVALLQDGPAGTIKLRTRAEFRMKTATRAAVLLCGWLTQHKHDTSIDSLESAIFEDKWLFTKYTCFGRMVYDPHTLKHYWINKPLIFNYFGYPDCLDTPYGPRFAPSFRFGYSQQFDQEDFAPPPIGYAILKSRPWTARDIVLYLRDWNYIAEGVNRPNIPIDVGNLDLPNGISWPKQAGEVLGTLRTIQHFDSNNTSLLDALTQTAKKVGAYEVYFTPKGNFVSEVGFVSMYAKSNTGTTLYMPTYGNPSLETVIDSANIIKYAKIIENDSNAFEQTRIIGDRPAVERFMSTNFFNPLPNGTSNGIVDGIPGCEGFLVPAWTPADEQAWKDYIQNHKTDHNDPNNPNDNR